MEWVIWGMAGLGGVVAVIFGVAAWRVMVRDRHLPNERLQPTRRPGTVARSDPSRGVPKSR